MHPDLNALRLARPDARISHSPFFVLEIENYLPAELYARLLQTYPDPSEAGYRHGMKNYLKSGTEGFAAFLAENPEWARLIRYMDSDEFLAHVFEYAQPIIRAARGKLGARRWVRNGKPVDGGPSLGSSWPSKVIDTLRYTEVETGFELSAMENGHCITAHSDAANKLVSILLYFPFPDWQPEWGGGTQFFRAKTPSAERRWCNPDVNHVKHFGDAGLKQFAEDMECFRTAPFAPNYLTMFCKSSHTFHAVDTIACPPDRRRNCLVLNVNAKDPDSALLKTGVDLVRKGKRLIRNRGRIVSPVDAGDGYN
jgi:hypothetical protein